MRASAAAALVTAALASVVVGAAVLPNCQGAPPAVVPAEAPSPRLRIPGVVEFIAFGDQGKGNDGQKRVAEAMFEVCRDRGCDFGVVLGDNLYRYGFEEPDDPRMKERFDLPYGPLDMPFYAVLGNHDYAHGRNHERALWQLDWAARSNLMEMPSQYYRFEADRAAFFALDTTRVFWYGETEQSGWLDRELAASKHKWKIVFGHHPYRSNGNHGNAGQYEGWRAPWVGGRSLRTLFEDRICDGVDLYLSGHDHNLQYLQHCGVELVVTGAAATTTPIVDRGNESFFEASQLGFVWIRLDENMTLAFFDDRGKLLFERVVTR